MSVWPLRTDGAPAWLTNDILPGTGDGDQCRYRRSGPPATLDPRELGTTLVQTLTPLQVRAGEDLAAQLERLGQVRAKQREIERAEARLRRERQFSRKMALNATLRALRRELAELGAV